MSSVNSDLDVALKTAREILDGTICECGDVEGNHVFRVSNEPRPCCADDCDCADFQPVLFSVERRQ